MGTLDSSICDGSIKVEKQNESIPLFCLAARSSSAKWDESLVTREQAAAQGKGFKNFQHGNTPLGEA